MPLEATGWGVPANFLHAWETLSPSHRVAVPPGNWLLAAYWGTGSNTLLSPKHLELLSQAVPGTHLSENAKQSKAEQSWEMRMWGQSVGRQEAACYAGSF